MSKLYAIIAYENCYQGLHGIIDYEVIEVESKKEAEDYAMEKSYEVMDSHSGILEMMYNDLDEWKEFNNIDDDEEYIEEWRSENVAYRVLEITKATNESLEALNEKFYNDPEGFIEEYDCV